MNKVPKSGLLLFALPILVCACVSFRSPYQRFVDAMNQEISLNRTIDHMEYDPKYPQGMYLADYHSLSNIEIGMHGTLVYHYAKKVLFGRYVCHYRVIVEQQTTIVIGWAFDTDLGDPKSTCGIAG